jgi:hypothetical protein
MRTTSTRSAVAALALALLTGLATLAPPAVADEQPGGAPEERPGVVTEERPGVVPELPPQASPTAVLAVADRVLSGDARAHDPEPTIALRDLRRALPELEGAARARAEDLLSPEDALSSSSTAAATSPLCGPHVCVHFASGTENPNGTSADWAKTTLQVLERVWRFQVGRMDYRRPRRDGDTGGRLDVHLSDIGDDRVYGYCAPTTGRRVAPGTCTLDNDYAPTQYPQNTPLQNLQVTAAHELFHAVQFGYDAWEDGWLMEATATWMEERIYDGIDDNRQYLRAGQLHSPGKSLDVFDFSGGYYGNWIWFEYLTTTQSPSVVRRIWNRAGAARGMPNEYSVEAVRRVLSHSGGFRNTYARFAGANTHPASAYPEGATYRRPNPARSTTLGAGNPAWSGAFRVNHQASRTLRVTPAVALDSARLQIRVDGPPRGTSPAVAVTVLRLDGSVDRRLVRLGRRGNGAIRTDFGQSTVRDVSISVVNASTRYRWCNQGDGTFACYGFPRDQRERFALAVRVRR